MNLLQEQKAVGAMTVISGVLALGCLIATLVAVNFNNEALSNPLLILSTAGASAAAARWSMILDLFGYYLLLIPIIYLLHDWMQEKTVWRNIITFSGLAYVLIGSIGASILAVIWPRIMTSFLGADAAEQQILKANFSLINDMVYGGMWNLLEMIFAFVWWGFTGYLLIKNSFRLIGALTLLTGISCLGDALSGIMEIGWLHELSLNIYLLLAVVWALAIGLFIIQKRLR